MISNPQLNKKNTNNSSNNVSSKVIKSKKDSNSNINNNNKKDKNNYELNKNDSSKMEVDQIPHASTSAKPQQQQQQQQTKEHAKMLEAFWKLSEYNQNTRLDGIQQIVNYFKQLDAEKNRENYMYVLNRLIKGLASNRKCSRLGFSCCLTELINLENKLNVQDLVDMGKKMLSNSKTDVMLTKEELRHMHIGYLFIYLCWIQSKTLLNKTDIVKQAAADLNDMRKKQDIKFYIQELYLQALILLIKKLDNKDLFKSLILSQINSDLKEAILSNQNKNKETAFRSNLNLLLACLNKYHDVTVENLSASSGDFSMKKIFNTKNFDLFFDLLSQSSESLPNLQPICVELIDYLVKHNQVYLKQMWSDLLDSKLCMKREAEKKLVCFKIYLYTLNQVNKSNFECLFRETLLSSSSNTIQSFIHNYAYKNTNLHHLCKVELGKELSEIVRCKETELSHESMGADLLIEFLKHTKNYHDISDLVSSFILNLNQKSLTKFFTYLTNDLNRQDLNDFDQQKNQSEEEVVERQLKLESLQSKQAWLVNQLSNYSRNKFTFDSKNGDLLTSIFNYLIINSYFDVVNFKNYKLNIGLRLEKNEKLTGSLRECLLEYVGVLLTRHTFSQARNLDQTKSLYSMFIETVESIKSFIENKTDVRLSEKLIKREQNLKDLSTKIIKLLKNILENITNNLANNNANNKEIENNIDVYQTFFIVTAIESIRMFDSVKSSKQIIDDIEVCINKFEEELKSTTETASNKYKKNKKNNKGKIKLI
jgi:hypothetical protein